MAKKEQMMNKFQKFVTIGVFISLIFVPSIAWIFCGGAIGDENSENRRLAEIPAFDITQIDKFPKQFDDFYNDHAPFRGVIRNIWANLNFMLLYDSTSRGVVVGKNDGDIRDAWLFYSGSENPVREVQGFTIFSDDFRKSVLDRYGSNRVFFNNKDINYYIFVVPNKENIYRENLPDSVEIYDNKSRTERLIEELQQKGANNIIYAKDEIVKEKEASVGQLYYKQDSHWNDLGGFYGFKLLTQNIVPGASSFLCDIHNISSQVVTKDLARILNIKDYFRDDIYEVTLVGGSDYEIGSDSIDDIGFTVMDNEDAPIDKTLLLVGDSYRTALLPYLGGSFKKVIAMHRVNYSRSILEKYHPDIVVNESVERFFVDAISLDFKQ